MLFIKRVNILIQNFSPVERIRSFCLPLITYDLGALHLRASDYLTLDNLLNNSLAKIVDTSYMAGLCSYLVIPLMKALCMS